MNRPDNLDVFLFVLGLAAALLALLVIGTLTS